MIKPTAHEIRLFSITGKMPESLKDRIEEAKKPKKKAAKKPAKSVEKDQDTVTVETVMPEYQRELENGWYELSNGKKKRGEENARKAQALLNA